MKNLLSEFKAFAMRGNVIDLAVGVVIGGAFGKIVASLVNDIIMPLISLVTGGASVADWKIVFKAATETTAESALTYGNFLQTVIDFLLIALSIFLVVKFLNNLKKKEEVPPPPAAPVEDTLSVLKDIRESLRK